MNMVIMLIELTILVATAIMLFYYLKELEFPKSIIFWALIIVSVFIIYAWRKTGNFGYSLNVLSTFFK